jgi:hypothetical protein
MEHLLIDRFIQAPAYLPITPIMLLLVLVFLVRPLFVNLFATSVLSELFLFFY